MCITVRPEARVTDELFIFPDKCEQHELHPLGLSSASRSLRYVLSTGIARNPNQENARLSAFNIQIRKIRTSSVQRPTSNIEVEDTANPHFLSSTLDVRIFFPCISWHENKIPCDVNEEPDLSPLDPALRTYLRDRLGMSLGDYWISPPPQAVR